MTRSKTAGGVVINNMGQVLVVNQNGKSWSLPKGHIDPGEDARTAAAREIKEESGVCRLEYVKDLGSYERYRIGVDGGEEKSELKHITIFLYKTDQMKLAPEDKDNPEARWVEKDEVASMLTHQKDKAFFNSIKSQINI